MTGLEAMVGYVEQVAESAHVPEPVQMTVGLTDGSILYAARYASGPVVNSLFVSENVESLRALYPSSERFAHFSDDARVVVSEPLVDLPGVWRAIPAGTALVVGDTVQERPFTPRPPSRPVAATRAG